MSVRSHEAYSELGQLLATRDKSVVTRVCAWYYTDQAFQDPDELIVDIDLKVPGAFQRGLEVASEAAGRPLLCIYQEDGQFYFYGTEDDVRKLLLHLPEDP